MKRSNQKTFYRCPLKRLVGFGSALTPRATRIRRTITLACRTGQQHSFKGRRDKRMEWLQSHKMCLCVWGGERECV